MNYYELLNIARDANGDEIKRAYFSAVKTHSPDFDPEGFKAVRTAYETLCDHKKRAEYDAYFVTSGDLQNQLLAARELIRENKYKQAVEFLTGLNDETDLPDVKRLLAEVLWYLKKNAAAEKLCRELLEQNPADCDTLMLCARIAASKGQHKKAGSYLSDAVNAAPLNPQAWSGYMYHAMEYGKNNVPVIFTRAMDLNEDMFRDDYVLYLVGAHDIGLFNNEKMLLYFDKFTEYFLNDKNFDKDTYWSIIKLIPGFLDNEDFIPYLDKIFPALEASRHRRDDDAEAFACMRMSVLIGKLRSDDRIHDVLVDMTGFLFSHDDRKDELVAMECYIVFNMPLLRPSIKVLKNEYPECFSLNRAFYVDVLNEKKTDYLIDTYMAKYRKRKPAAKAELPASQLFDDDYDGNDETDESMPFVREAPKIGRNDPCPCGSGKKYKKCCGRGV